MKDNTNMFKCVDLICFDRLFLFMFACFTFAQPLLFLLKHSFFPLKMFKFCPVYSHFVHFRFYSTLCFNDWWHLFSDISSSLCYVSGQKFIFRSAILFNFLLSRFFKLLYHIFFVFPFIPIVFSSCCNSFIVVLQTLSLEMMTWGHPSLDLEFTKRPYNST